ncbi:hypothetical protein CY35_08G012100 [Sphagnum magellanicum]|jgi:hypothetical protein|nr:hypothetical protein CY35_08G012100 [Sphagnum magellanicum]KAH9553476.1 hypothetical protein CY35_08G012100 [Sphagnum magellanicum]KAH9553477.1 hypothetical protein CY35_08G012100 [Sphagnum magellanicum]
MKPNGSSYEDVRKQRMEENKRRMEELGLADLSKSLSKPKVSRPYRKRPTLEEQGLQRRRSSRVAAIQEAKEEVMNSKDESEEEASDSGDSDPESPVVRKSYSFRSNRKSLPWGDSSNRASIEATEAAEDIEKELENPGFVISMLQLDVSSDFLKFPDKFCKEYLPSGDHKIKLMHEEKEWETLFVANLRGLSEGWMGFVQDKKLEAGDACVFELIAKDGFKIHIVQASEQASANTGKNGSGDNPKKDKKGSNGEQAIDLESSEDENVADATESGDEWVPRNASDEDDDNDDTWKP